MAKPAEPQSAAAVRMQQQQRNAMQHEYPAAWSAGRWQRQRQQQRRWQQQVQQVQQVQQQQQQQVQPMPTR